MKPQVIHLYPKEDGMITQYVSMLEDGAVTDTSSSFPLVHVHGCWNHAIIKEALRSHARIILSPHGQLQPWILEKEKTTAMQPWQRRFTRQCYAVIAQGKMEQENLKKLGWNPRIEIIGNPLVTTTTTQEEARRRTAYVYQKTLDSNPRELMSEETLAMIPCLLKAGITGDRRWIRKEVPKPENVNWRLLLIYSYHEGIDRFIHQGIRVLQFDVPDIDVSKIDCYLPPDYEKPEPLNDITALAEALSKRPTICHLSCLLNTLYHNDLDDDETGEALRQRGQLKFFQRLMAVMRDLTLLDEGFMPVEPIDDNETEKIRNIINNHLKL